MLGTDDSPAAVKALPRTGTIQCAPFPTPMPNMRRPVAVRAMGKMVTGRRISGLKTPSFRFARYRGIRSFRRPQMGPPVMEPMIAPMKVSPCWLALKLYGGTLKYNGVMETMTMKLEYYKQFIHLDD